MELNVGRWTCAVVNPWTPLRIFLAVLFSSFLFRYILFVPMYSMTMSIHFFQCFVIIA